MHAIAHLIRTRCAINHSHVNFYTVKACYRLVYIFFSFKVSEYPFKQKMLKNTLKNRVRDFLFKYFLSNALLTVFMQNALSKRRIIEIKNE